MMNKISSKIYDKRLSWLSKEYGRAEDVRLPVIASLPLLGSKTNSLSAFPHKVVEWLDPKSTPPLMEGAAVKILRDLLSEFPPRTLATHAPYKHRSFE